MSQDQHHEEEEVVFESPVLIEIISSPDKSVGSGSDRDWQCLDDDEVFDDDEVDFDENEEISRMDGWALTELILQLVEKELDVTRRMSKKGVRVQLFYTIVDLWKMKVKRED